MAWGSARLFSRLRRRPVGDAVGFGFGGGIFDDVFEGGEQEVFGLRRATDRRLRQAVSMIRPGSCWGRKDMLADSAFFVSTRAFERDGPRRRLLRRVRPGHRPRPAHDAGEDLEGG